MNRLALTGIGLCTPLGPQPDLRHSAVQVRASLGGLPDDRSAQVKHIDLRPWLKRRKDRKLMARAAQLALAAAGPALAGWPGGRDELGLFLGVGREQGDEGESEAALLAAQRGGRVVPELVAGPCRDRYPPLLPLKTLPNMALAHISINLDVRGENGAWAGGPGAGMCALRSGCWAVLEGRVPAALVGAADSLSGGGNIRDRYRLSGPTPPPVGEAGVMFLIETEAVARQRGAPVYAWLSIPPPGALGLGPTHHAQLGDCGAADGVLSTALAVLGRSSTRLVSAADLGHPAQSIEISVDSDCACYTRASDGESL